MSNLKSNLKLLGGKLAPSLFQVRGRPTRSGGKRIALSFDDGPLPEHTPRLLDCFAEAGLKTTFFVIGELVEKHPELVRRMLDEGHEVANHSYEHFNVRKMGDEEYLQDLLRCQRVLNEAVGEEMPLTIRPPYGILRPRTTFALARQGYRHVLWSVDSDDSSLAEGQSLAAHMAKKTLVDGDIVLLHEDYVHTIEEMPAILADLLERGFTPVRCCDLLEDELAPEQSQSRERDASTACTQ